MIEPLVGFFSRERKVAWKMCYVSELSANRFTSVFANYAITEIPACHAEKKPGVEVRADGAH